MESMNKSLSGMKSVISNFIEEAVKPLGAQIGPWETVEQAIVRTINDLSQARKYDIMANRVNSVLYLMDKGYLGYYDDCNLRCIIGYDYNPNIQEPVAIVYDIDACNVSDVEMICNTIYIYADTKALIERVKNEYPECGVIGLNEHNQVVSAYNGKRGRKTDYAKLFGMLTEDEASDVLTILLGHAPKINKAENIAQQCKSLVKMVSKDKTYAEVWKKIFARRENIKQTLRNFSEIAMAYLTICPLSKYTIAHLDWLLRISPCTYPK